MINSISVFKVTNNIFDVFYGDYGYDKKERVLVKKTNTEWQVLQYPRKYEPEEVEFGCIKEFNEHWEQIKELLNVWIRKQKDQRK